MIPLAAQAALEFAAAPKIIARMPFLERADHPAAMPVFVVSRAAADAMVTETEVWSMRVAGWSAAAVNAVAALADVIALPDRAFDGAEKTLAIVFRKAEFWKRHSATPFNERQHDIINRLLDGFDGNLTSSKWAIIEKCSADTALRDITDLLQRGLLRKNEGGGRSTSYSLAEGPPE